MCKVVTPPSAEQIERYYKSSGLILSPDHKALLEQWGGSNLDEIRIRSLEKIEVENFNIEFADDYNGFIYQYNKVGEVFADDTDGGEIIKLANSIEEFINEVFLGLKGEDFYGKEWVSELKDHGLA